MTETLFSYLSIKKLESSLYKDKGSKFIGFVFPCSNTDEFKLELQKIKKEYHSARHFCYAFSFGLDVPSYRYSDDGEPSNSAGAPIYGQIKSFKLSNVGIVVVRYFGGTKLGVPGLIKAYKTAAKMAINEATIIEIDQTIDMRITFDIESIQHVMTLLKQNNINIKDASYQPPCYINCILPLKIKTKVENQLQKLHQISYEILE